MSNAQTTKTGPLSAALVNKKVGFIRITKPQEYRQQYEVAAWYTQYESDLGDFDLILRRDHLYPERLFVEARVSATVTSNYHAPLLCGVAVGTGRDDTGQRGEMPIKFEWAEAAAGKHRSGIEVYIDRDNLAAAIEYSEMAMRRYADDFPRWYASYCEEPRNAHHSNIGMVAHYGENMAKWGRLLAEILRQKENRFGYFARYERVQDETVTEIAIRR